MPPWVRILRIQRDIPVKLIEAGIKKSHLRELVLEELGTRGERCRCIRCREIGHQPAGKTISRLGDAEFSEESYSASGGKEFFLSYTLPSTDSLVGYARLRIPGGRGVERGLLRELHVYGEMVPISQEPRLRWQHQGFGEKLMAAAEEKASASGMEGLLVTSGVGARNYYRRLGYEREGPYMAKPL
jgi:elongator complex protein 3